MRKLFQDVDAGMRRAVQQESRVLSSGLSSVNDKKRQKKPQGRCCLLIIMLSPVVVMLVTMYVLNIYRNMVRYEQQQKQQQLLSGQAPMGEQNYKQPQQLQNIENESQLQEQQMLRKRQADVARLEMTQEEEEDDEEEESIDASGGGGSGGGMTTLVLTTSLGPIRIQLRPDLSKGSVDYIRRLIASKKGCQRCNFYRAEKPGILQGVMKHKDIATNQELGSCPPGAESVINVCPQWDPQCKCHGPVMTRGSVAWAAGLPGGPDFFIDNYQGPAKWWGTQHTNFGFIEDSASMAIVDQVLNLPVTANAGLHYLEAPIPFTMSLE